MSVAQMSQTKRMAILVLFVLLALLVLRFGGWPDRSCAFGDHAGLLEALLTYERVAWLKLGDYIAASIDNVFSASGVAEKRVVADDGWNLCEQV